MIHLYVTLPHPEPPCTKAMVEEILALNAGVGLVQTAPGGDTETMRRVATSHILVRCRLTTNGQLTITHMEKSCGQCSAVVSHFLASRSWTLTSDLLEQPLGVNGLALHEWMMRTRGFQATQGESGGETGVDDFVTRGFAGIGAWIMGRNMFRPIRRPWNDKAWKGWWGRVLHTTAPCTC